MKNFYVFAASMLIGANVWAAQPFTKGNLVLYRVGDGVAAFDKTAAPVFLDEYKIEADGMLKLVQSVAMPVQTNGTNMRLTLPCTSHLEGAMTRSEDGRYLVVPGYNAEVGASVASAERVGALVDYQGNVDATTGMPSSCLESFRGVASADGSGIYFSGKIGKAPGSLFYSAKGSFEPSPLSTVGTLRHVRVIDGQLLAGSDSYWYEIGEGLPTADEQVRKEMMKYYQKSGFYDIYIAHLPQGKVAYVASTGAALNNVAYKGIFKYSLVEDAWVYNGRTAPTTNCHGLEGKVDESGLVTLYITVGNASATDVDKVNDRKELEYNEERICMLTDNSGFNNSGFEGTTVKEVLKAPENQAYRAIAWAPLQDAITSVAETKTQKAHVRVEQGALVVVSAVPVEITVYSVLGNKVYEGSQINGEYRIEGLAPGQLYVVKAGELVKKVIL